MTNKSHFEWDETKNQDNQKKHGVPFEIAQYAFADQNRIILEDLDLNQLCTKMYEMEHPYVIYKDISITPWDICNVLMSEKIAESYEPEFPEKMVCPHCGKAV